MLSTGRCRCMSAFAQTDNAAPLSRFVQVALAALAIVVCLFLLRETAAEIVWQWYSSATYNHGFLIIPICLYLAWRERSAARDLAVAPELRGVLLVGLVCAAWLVGHVTGTLVVQELCLVAIIQAVILTMFGWPVARKFAFPLLYLYFAVPMGDSLEPRLQSITASLAVDLLKLSGVPVFADGNFISVPTGNFDVAEECSGLRFLTASMAIGTLFAMTIYRSWWRRAAFVGLSFFVPIVANGVRAFGIIWLAYSTNNVLAHGVDHIVYGWVFFSLVLLLVLLIGMSFREDRQPLAASGPGPRASAPRSKPVPSILIAGLIALAPVAGAKFYAAHTDRPVVARTIELPVPAAGGGWLRGAASGDWLPPVLAGPDAKLSVRSE